MVKQKNLSGLLAVRSNINVMSDGIGRRMTVGQRWWLLYTASALDTTIMQGDYTSRDVGPRDTMPKASRYPALGKSLPHHIFNLKENNYESNKTIQST